MSNETNQGSQQPLDVLFLANFVHQVINPMNGIAGTLDNIADGTYIGEQATRKANAARGQLEATIGLIRNLAFFADISSSNTVLREPSSNSLTILPQAVIESLQFYQDVANDRGVRLELNDRDTQYAIRTRPEALKQVLMNLFDNATKYSDGSTRVTVTSGIQSDGSLSVAITNFGIGFSGTEREKIFDLSYRSASAKASKALGSGLGLFICRKIMSDIIGGSIKAEHNNKTRETKFTLKFPQQKWFIK